MVETVLPCECGFEARAADEEGLLAEVRRHALEAHAMTLSREEALLVAARARAVDDAPPPSGDGRRKT
jgi:predicted small metal-binding protein